MNYEIVEFIKTLGRIRVTYGFEGRALATSDLEIPIEDNRYITGEQLDSFIMSCAPYHLLDRADQIKVVKNTAEFEALEGLTSNPGTYFFAKQQQG